MRKTQLVFLTFIVVCCSMTASVALAAGTTRLLTADGPGTAIWPTRNP